MSSFIPSSYDISSLSGGDHQYFKVQNGENKIRILSEELVFGYEYWTTENKPKRLKTRPAITPSDIRLNDDGKPSPVREIWLMFVWDYSDGQVKIWNFYQMSLKKDLTALSNDEDWGHPNQYDIKITKTGANLKTEYKIIASPKKELTQSQLDAVEEKVSTFDLNSLFNDSQALPQPVTAIPKPTGFSRTSGTSTDAIKWAVSKGIDEETAKNALEDINAIAKQKASEGSPMSNDDRRASFISSIEAYLAEHPEVQPIEANSMDDIPF